MKALWCQPPAGLGRDKGKKREETGHCPWLAGVTAAPELLFGEQIFALSSSDPHEPSFPTAIKWGNKVGRRADSTAVG